MPYHRVVAQEVALRAPVGARVIDLGHGNGDVLAQLHTLRPDLALTGLDGELRTTHLSTSGFAAVEADFDEIEQLPPFDLAISLHVLEHLENPLRLARLVAQGLRAGGEAAYLGVPNLVAPIPLVNALGRRSAANPGHLYGWDRPHFELFLRAAGLEARRWITDSVQVVPGRMRGRTWAWVDRAQSRLARPAPFLSETLLAEVVPISAGG